MLGAHEKAPQRGAFLYGAMGNAYCLTASTVAITRTSLPATMGRP